MTDPDETGTGISAERKAEIAFEFKDLLNQGKDSEEAADILCAKYSASKANLNQIIHEENTDEDDFDEDDEKDEQPGD